MNDTATLKCVSKAKAAAEQLSLALLDVQQLDGLWIPETIEGLIRNLYYYTGMYEERIRASDQAGG